MAGFTKNILTLLEEHSTHKWWASITVGRDQIFDIIKQAYVGLDKNSFGVIKKKFINKWLASINVGQIKF